MEKQELKNRINEFCESKNFNNPFIKECITEFIEGHIKLYGDVIPVEDVFKRLEENLDKITFKGPEEARNGELGEYKGRVKDNTDLNEISIYFNESDLELSEYDRKFWDLFIEEDKKKLLQNVAQKRSMIKTTLLHELTHSLYTVKDRYGIGENHIFSVTGENIFFKDRRI